MDRPSNLMMICGVLLFREKVSLARFKAVIGERFLVFERFRQRPVEAAATVFWETDPAFDLDHHVARMTLPGKPERASCRRSYRDSSRRRSIRRDRCGSFCVVDNFAGGCAVILRIHHCYADGIALVRVMLSMTDSAPAGPPAMPFEPRKRTPASADDGISSLLAPFGDALGSARKIGGNVDRKRRGDLERSAQAVELAGRGSALTAEIAKLALMSEDSPTRFKGRAGRRETRRLGRPAVVAGSQSDRQGARRIGQRCTACLRRRRAARLPDRKGRCCSTA
jgi:hypothetical protein